MTSITQTFEFSNSQPSIEIDWLSNMELSSDFDFDQYYGEVALATVPQSIEENVQSSIQEPHSQLMREASPDFVDPTTNPVNSISGPPLEPVVQVVPENASGMGGVAISQVSSVTESEDQKVEAQLRFLRHKLQKGLLSKGQLPKPEGMGTLSSYLKKLDHFGSPSPNAIRTAKIPKLLRRIGRLDEIPRDDEFRFKERVISLYEKWEGILEKDQYTSPAAVQQDSDGNIEPSSGPHNRQSSRSSMVQKPPENSSESHSVTEKYPYEVTLGSTFSRKPTSNQSPKLDAVPNDKQPSPPSYIAIQHPSDPESQHVVVDLTDEWQPDSVTEPDLSASYGTGIDIIRSVQKRCSSLSSTNHDQLATGGTMNENNSSPVSDIVSNTRKRKRSDLTIHDSSQGSDSQTDGSSPAHLCSSEKSRPSNKSHTRRRGLRKTSPKKHLSNEIVWMTQSVKMIEEIKGFDLEIDAIKVKRARLLDEIEEEMNMAMRQRGCPKESIQERKRAGRETKMKTWS